MLDLSVRCNDPEQACAELMQPLGAFLERVRPSGVPIIFTASFSARGTPMGEVATALKHRPEEPLIFPDAFDKFVGGELHDFLSGHNVRNLIVVGSSTNNAVMYTASAAARVHKYNVIIPLDGVNTRNAYEHEYGIHQLTVLPRGSATPVKFTRLSMIEFG